MSTIIDLNTATTVNFNNQADYAISFGANAGNATANVDAYGSLNIAKQTPLNSITSPVRDLLIDVQFSNVGVVNMSYAGPYANIGLLQISPAAWRVNGIRSVAQYDEAFANVRYFDLTGSGNTSPEYSYITTVNDQSGNTRTWSTTVDVAAPPVLTNTGPVLFNEDALANITQLSITGNTSASSTYVLTSSIMNQSGQVSNTTATGNSVTVTGNIATITTAVAAGNLKFVPPTDLTSNIANALNFQLSINDRLASQANANVQIGNVHDEYSILGGTGNLLYAGLVNNSLAYTITDLANDSTYDVSFNATGNASTSSGIWVVNSANVGTLGGNLVLTGQTKAQVNSANISWHPVNNIDTATPTQFAFSQIKHAPDGNEYIQASNVVLTFSAAPVSNVISGITQYYNGSSLWRNYNPVGNVVTSYQYPIPDPYSEYDPVVVDGPIAPETTEGNPVYTVTLTQTTPNVGNIELRGLFAGNVSQFNPNSPIANSITITGNRVAVNNRFVVYSGNSTITNNNVAYTPPAGYTGNIDMTYTQTKTVGNVTIMQANAVPFTMNIVDAAFNTGVKADAATPLTVSNTGFTGLNQTWTFEDGGGIPPANPFVMFNYMMKVDVSLGNIWAVSGGPTPTITNWGNSVWLSNENAVSDVPQWTVADPWVGNTSSQTRFGVGMDTVRNLLLNKCIGAGTPPSSTKMQWETNTQTGTGNITVSMYRIDPLVSIYDFYGNVPTASRKLVNSVTTVVTFNNNPSPTGS